MNAGIYGLTSQEALGPYPLLGRPAPVPTVDPLVGFDPRAIPSIRLWLDASNSGSMLNAATGGTPCGPDDGVGRWEDQSGNGLHVLQGIANNRPIRKVQSLNGLDGIQFDGNNDFLYAANRMTSKAATVFMVTRAATSTARYCYWDFGNVSINQSLAVEQNTFNTAGSRWGFFGSLSSTSNSTYDTTLATSTATSIVTTAFDVRLTESTEDCVIYALNGTLSGRLTRKFGNANDWRNYTALTSCMLGSLNNGGSGLSGVYFNGIMYEFIVCDTFLPAIQRRMVERYLSQKWGITVA